MTLRARSARKSADGASAHKSPSERSGHILLEPRGSGMFEDIKAHDLTAPMCMVLVNIAGHVTHVQGSRIDIADRFGISQRDLRLLDPWAPMPFPISFMIRKAAILANLGAVRVLISRSECVVLSVGRFTEEYMLTEEPEPSDRLVQQLKGAITTSHDAPISAQHDRGLHLNLPFELRALEVSLDEALRLLAVEVRGVISSAKARMHTLAHGRDSTRSTLEQLKSIRTTAVALTTRVRKFKTELEDILTDDQDMLDMYLQRRHEVDEGIAPQGARVHAGTRESAPHGSTLSQRLPSVGMPADVAPAQKPAVPLAGHPHKPAATPLQVHPNRDSPAPPGDSAWDGVWRQRRQPTEDAVLGTEAVRAAANVALQAATQATAPLQPSAAPAHVARALGAPVRAAGAVQEGVTRVVAMPGRSPFAVAPPPDASAQAGRQSVPESGAEEQRPGISTQGGSAPLPRIPLKDRARKSTRMGQHGWDVLHTAHTRGRLKAEHGPELERIPGSTDADSQTLRHSAAGQLLEGRTTFVDEGVCSSHGSHSFSTQAEAVPLETVPKVSPHPSHRASTGAGLNAPHPSVYSRPTEDRIASAPDALPHADPHAHSADLGGAGGRDAASSSSHSTEIIQHLLDLKHQAHLQGLGGKAAVDPHDVQDVENMLEAYSLQADHLLAQMSDLAEELDDFQEDTQVELDRKRNALFALQLLITIVTMGFSFVSMIGGIFGMNLWDGMGQSSAGWFVGVTVASSGIATVVTVLLLVYLRMHRMLFMGE